MPQHLKALIVILVLAWITFAIARRPLIDHAIAPSDYVRRRNLWFATILIAFLSHNFWIYMLLCGGLFLHARRRESNPLALFCLLLFAVPLISVEIPGLVINYIIGINHFRLLSIVVLLPAALRLHQQVKGEKALPTDWFLGAYLVLLVILTLIANGTTGAMRQAVVFVIDAWLPYYVASRSLRNVRSFQEFAACFVLAGVIMSAIAMVEQQRHWLLYSALDEALGASSAMGGYLARGDGLRASASAGHPIILGYLLVVAIGMLIAIRPTIRSNRMWWLCAAALAGGMFASLSRGPWVGAAGLIVLVSVIGPNASRRTARLIGYGSVVIAALLVSPWGNKLLNLLPFIGETDSGSVDYRTLLFNVAFGLLLQSPWFGVWDFFSNPEAQSLRTGEGIIDLVNSYLSIGLGSGFVGLFFFVGAFFTAGLAAWRTYRVAAKRDVEVEQLGRGLLGAFLGVLITIATVSSIGTVPVVYWMLAGVCVAYARAFAYAPRPPSASAGFANGPAYRRRKTGLAT